MEMLTESYAQQQDEQDTLRHLRSKFIIPSKGDLARRTLAPETARQDRANEPSIYLCGNSLGLQPTLTREYMQRYLDTWAAKGVYGHFQDIEDSNLPPWLHVDDDLQRDMAQVVGALPSEIAIMQTLTANLHLMMASFYRPTEKRFKIILEGKAFPSDHYAVESHLRHHNLDPKDAMVVIEPPPRTAPLLSTDHILSVIDRHSSDTALLLLSGIQFYTGQYFDMPAITAYAHSKGITVGWDLAHAAGNVPTQLHDWNIDFAVWCTYKYLNCGPGAIGGCFVHEKHGQVTEMNGSSTQVHPQLGYRPRLAGWWGSSKASRFDMTNEFQPIPGAAGYQLSNTSVGDGTAVRASLDIFKQTSMDQLREKSLKLTNYLEYLLDHLASEGDGIFAKDFSIITPRNPAERGAQLSVLLAPGLLDPVMHTLEEEGVVLDERKPDVIRVAPAPLYNNHMDVFKFVNVLRQALLVATSQGKQNGGGIMVEGGKDAKGWGEIQ